MIANPDNLYLTHSWKQVSFNFQQPTGPWLEVLITLVLFQQLLKIMDIFPLPPACPGSVPTNSSVCRCLQEMGKKGASLAVTLCSALVCAFWELLPVIIELQKLEIL